jgi:general secretion pathway protein C
MKVDQILRRYFWAVVGVLVSVVALLHAQALTQIIGIYRLGLDASELSAAPVSARTVPTGMATGRSISADAILSRNPFDSVTGPLHAPEVPLEPVAAQVDMSDPMHAPHCEGIKVLVIAESTDPEWSFAALTTGSGAEAKSVLRRKGGEVNGKTVEWISWDRVWLASGRSLCQLEMFAPMNPKQLVAAETDAGAPHAPPPREGSGSIDPEIARGIQRVSATEFKVDRGVVDKILENQAELMRQARIVPEQENGKMVGIRLFGVRPDTLLGVLGMENGDRLQTINGFDMTSPEKALEAYARLRTADTLTVQVNRRGTNTNLDYHIQ